MGRRPVHEDETIPYKILYESGSWKKPPCCFSEKRIIVCAQAIYYHLIPDILKFFDRDQPMVIAFIRNSSRTENITQMLASFFTNIACISVSNRGMDILPFFIQLKYLKAKQCSYDWIIKIHTKHDHVLRWISTHWVQDALTITLPIGAGLVGPSILYYDYDEFIHHPWLFSSYHKPSEYWAQLGISDAPVTGSGFFAFTQFMIHNVVAGHFSDLIGNIHTDTFSEGRPDSNNMFEHFCERLFGFLTVYNKKTCILLPSFPGILDHQGVKNDLKMVCRPPARILDRILFVHIVIYPGVSCQLEDRILHEYFHFHFDRHAFDMIMIIAQSSRTCTELLQIVQKLCSAIHHLPEKYRHLVSVHVETTRGAMTSLRNAVINTSGMSVSLFINPSDWPWMVWLDQPVPVGYNGKICPLHVHVTPTGHIQPNKNIRSHAVVSTHLSR